MLQQTKRSVFLKSPLKLSFYRSASMSFIIDLPNYCTKCDVQLFADDTIIYCFWMSIIHCSRILILSKHGYHLINWFWIKQNHTRCYSREKINSKFILLWILSIWKNREISWFQVWIRSIFENTKSIIKKLTYCLQTFHQLVSLVSKIS